MKIKRISILFLVDDMASGLFQLAAAALGTTASPAEKHSISGTTGSAEMKIHFRAVTGIAFFFAGCLLLSGSPVLRNPVSFDDGWESFTVRLNEADSAFAGRKPIPSAGWKVLSVSSQETQSESAPAAKAFDNDPGTFWHTRYTGGTDKMPHELVIDLGKAVEASAFFYQGRQDASKNGLVRDFETYFSESSADWGAPVVKAACSDRSAPQVFDFQQPRKGRHLKFVAKSALNGAPFAGAAELGLLGISAKSLGTSWESQFTTEHTDQSQALAPMTDADLVKLRPGFAKADWKPVMLPHTAVIEPREISNPQTVLAFYRKTFTPPAEWQGKRVALEFEGVMQISDYWLNGEHLHFQAGGYMGFVLDLSDKLKFGQPNELIVRADNREHPLVPPGKPVKSMDFCYHSGIYRDVNLLVTDPLHITHPLEADTVAGGGIFVTYPEVSAESATVQIKVQIKNNRQNSSDAAVRCSLSDRPDLSAVSESIPLASGETKEVILQIKVQNPKLWYPDSPNLYSLKTELIADQQTVDTQSQRIGIRKFEVSKAEGLKINGKPIRIVGANRHQEYPWIGNALSNEANYRDAWIIKNGGFNLVRLCHYTQDPSFYEACDELGILVTDEIPGWQFFNKNPEFTNRVFRDTREMIRRDRNHPCVLFWETSLNEANPPVEFSRKLVVIAHQEFPGCLTSGDSSYTGPKNPTTFDVPHNTFVQTKDSITRKQLVETNNPCYNREYGDYEFGGGSSTTRRRRSAGEQELLNACWNFYWEDNLLQKDWPQTIGNCIWVMFDHNRGWDPRVSCCGAADLLRIPKFTYYFYQSQRNPAVASVGHGIEAGPMVYIANYWTPRPSPAKVVVFSNGEEVELMLNGKSVARQKPDEGPDTAHPQFSDKPGLSRWDGGNCRNLDHPAFTFNISFESGELKAVAYINGRKVAEHAVKTPGKPAKIRLTPDLAGKPLAKAAKDTLFIRAEIIDGNGTMIPDATLPVSFKLANAELASPETVPAEAGIATALIITHGNGAVAVTATAEGLPSAQITINQ